MKSLTPAPAPSRARNRIDRPPAYAKATAGRQAGSYSFLLSLVLWLVVFSAHSLRAQVGNQNPSGPSGIFNGLIADGVDPYTGNVTRSITDIAVAGAVGEYPLALVRTANSRAPSTTEVFGWAGGWNHNYNWILEESERSQTQTFHPASYTVEFPDGRVETFKQVDWDSCYRVRASSGGAGSSAGVRERFLPLDLNTMYAYLVLPDGGAVEFKAVRYTNVNHDRWWYKYHATGIYDPHGLKTTIASAMTPNEMRRRITQVTEPAGRYLQFSYTGPNDPRISQVQEFINGVGRRTVNYYYIYCNGCRLNQVRYYNNAAWDAHYQYTNSNIGGESPPLLWTADDPMYSGRMKRLAYDYKPGPTPHNPDGTTPVYGQIWRERYWDGVLGNESSGPVVSTLTVGLPNNSPAYRTETRGDSATRTFVYNGAGLVTWASDFMAHQSTMGYDDKKYLNSYIDFNRNETDYINDPITGNVLQIQFPFTHEDTPNQSVRPTINYIYGGAGCTDPNNQDPYWVCTATDEAGNQTRFTRDPVFYRVTRIDYPDGGYETFGYDPSHFYQLNSHRMLTGGTETFAYDGLHRKQYYSDAYHSNPDNPSIRYFYDALGRISGVSDALNHSTNWDYNDRGQVTVTTLPWYNGTRYTITNAYNPNGDGTLVSRTDELGHLTSYTYDDYRRLKSVTLPARGDGTGTHTTNYYYWSVGLNDDYRHTDAQPRWVVLPSGKRINTVYDDNWRKTDVTVGWNTPDAATTSYGYDGMGNVTRGTNPRGYVTTTVYDERNRPSSITEPTNRTTAFTYDTAGRKKSITRPNGQVTTYASFDEMNRVKQQNVTQTPTGLAITKFTYYPSGLLHTMQDPRLVATQSSETCSYLYDLVGRKTRVTYPIDSGVRRNEQWSYDTAGRLQAFTNRAGQAQTFNYDALSRMTGFSWDDTPRTPSVTFGYDAGSRLTDINNANATISRIYWNDNLLRTETETPTGPGGIARSVSDTFNADGNPDTLQIPGYTFSYTYTGRNQLKGIKNGATTLATYGYDENGYVGDLTSRTLNNSTHTTYNYDPLDRVTWISHYLNGTGRGFNYGYYDDSNNRKYVRRTGSTLGDVGDVFDYDLADQAIAVQLNVAHPDSTPVGNQTIFYDPNGNRNWFSPPDHSEQYVINNLNQYTSRNSNNAVYEATGNLTQSPDPAGSRLTCSYDAQNRLTSASKNSTTMTFKYDGLNRQVSRTVRGITTYSVWDRWDLVQEYRTGPTVTASYLYGATGLVKNLLTNNYYYQDGSGSTSHLANSGGALLEWYRYDLQGTPFFYNSSDQMVGGSNAGVRHLFTGQQWYSDVGLYDLRNRFYSPDLGRLLQPDPIGFRGDRSNLYCYCGNNPVTRSDPSGLQVVPTPVEKGVVVWGPETGPWGFDPGELGFPPGEVSMPGGNLPGGDPGGGGPGRGGRRSGRQIEAKDANGNWIPITTNYDENVVASELQPLVMDPSLPPLGSPANPIHFNDSFLFQVLASERGTVSSANLQKMGYLRWAKYMLKLNVPAFYNSSYYSYDGYLSEMNGIYSGHEINYLGVGMGLAAYGMSEEQMTAYIFGWKDSQYLWYGLTFQWSRLQWSGIRGSEFMWAELGYTYYANGGHL